MPQNAQQNALLFPESVPGTCASVSPRHRTQEYRTQTLARLITFAEPLIVTVLSHLPIRTLTLFAIAACYQDRHGRKTERNYSGFPTIVRLPKFSLDLNGIGPDPRYPILQKRA